MTLPKTFGGDVAMDSNDVTQLGELLKLPAFGRRELSRVACPHIVKAFAWARVSTEAPGGMGLSIPEQLRQIRAYAKERGIEIVAEFWETASAFQDEEKRVEFHRMLAAAKANREVELILVHELSRFSRRSLGARTHIRDLQKAGVRVVSLNDETLDPATALGVYLEAITFAKNEAFSREISFHVRKGCHANIRTRDSETGWCYKNGGRVLWGYRALDLHRGQKRRNHPIIKTVWVLDDTLVAGRPVYRWVRHCLLKLAAQGATVPQLCAFCDDHHLPTVLGGSWSQATWCTLLKVPCLLQYAGYGVWGVRGEGDRVKHPSEWVIVERAHPAIITLGEAMAVACTRRRLNNVHIRSARNTEHLLAGGVLRCGHCGGIMYVRDKRYYACKAEHGPPSVDHRLPIAQVDAEVLAGFWRLLESLSRRSGIVAKVNQEIRQHWATKVVADRGCAAEVAAKDEKAASVSPSVECGMSAVLRVDARLQQLPADKQELMVQTAVTDCLPQVEAKAIMACLRAARTAFRRGSMVERKRLLYEWLDRVEAGPYQGHVDIHFSLADQVTRPMSSGVRCAAASKLLSDMLRSRAQLPVRRRQLTAWREWGAGRSARGSGGQQAASYRPLSDEQWRLIAPHLPPRKREGRPRVDDRRTLNGIFWVLRAGARWQDMPRQYGCPGTCWDRLREWLGSGVWARLWGAVLSDSSARSGLEWLEALLHESAPAMIASEPLGCTPQDHMPPAGLPTCAA